MLYYVTLSLTINEELQIIEEKRNHCFENKNRTVQI